MKRLIPLVLLLILALAQPAMNHNSSGRPGQFRKPGNIILNVTADSVGFVFGSDTSWFAATGVQYRITNATDGSAFDLDTGIYIMMDSGGSADSAYAFGYGFGGSAFNDMQDAGFHHIFAQTDGDYYGIYITTNDSLTPFGQPILIGSNTRKYGGSLMKINAAGYGNGLHISKAASDTSAGVLLRIEDASGATGLYTREDSTGTALLVRVIENPSEGGRGVALGSVDDAANSILLDFVKGSFNTGTIGTNVILNWSGGTDGQVLTYQADGTTKFENSAAGSTDSFYVAEAASTTTGWKQSGDTIFVDTTSSSGGGTTDSVYVRFSDSTSVGTANAETSGYLTPDDTLYMDTTNHLPLSGGTMSGTITMNDNTITGLDTLFGNSNGLVIRALGPGVPLVLVGASGVGGIDINASGAGAGDLSAEWNFGGDLASVDTFDLVMGQNNITGVNNIVTDSLDVDTIIISGDVITDFAGTNLSVTAGVLNASAGSGLWDTLGNDSTLVYVASDTMLKVSADDDTTFISSADNGVLVVGVSGGLTSISDSLYSPRIRTDSMFISGDAITDFAGTNLSVTSGVLNAAGGAGVWADTTGNPDSVYFIDTDNDTGIVISDNDLGTVEWDIGPDQSYLKIGAKADSIQLGPAGLTEVDSLRILGALYLVSGADTVQYKKADQGSDGQVLHIDVTGDSLYWDTDAGAGETNTISSVGEAASGADTLTAGKSGVDLRVKSIIAGTNLTTVVTDSTVTLDQNRYWKIAGIETVLARAKPGSGITFTQAGDSVVIGHDAHTGDVTGTTALTIADSAVTPIKLATASHGAMGDSARAAATDTAAALRAEMPDSITALNLFPSLDRTYFDTTLAGNDSVIVVYADSSGKVADDVMNHTLDSSEVVTVVRDSGFTSIWDSSKVNLDSVLYQIVGEIDGVSDTTIQIMQDTGSGDNVYIQVPDGSLYLKGAADSALNVQDGSIDLADLAANSVDSTKVVANSLSMPSDVAAFTEAELEGRLSNVTALFTNNVTGDVTVSGGASTIGANTIDSSNIVAAGVVVSDLANNALSAMGDSARAAAADTATGIRNGSVWTGVHDAGGATSLEIPNSVNPTTNAAGEVAWDSDDYGLEVYDGTASMLIQAKKKMEALIWNPDLITDTVPIFYVDSILYPGGIEIIRAELQTSVDGAYSLIIPYYTAADPPVLSDYIDTLVVGAADQRIASTTFENSTIAVGQFVYIITPATDIDWIRVSLLYYVKDNN